MKKFKPIILILIFAHIAPMLGAQENNGAVTASDIFAMVPSLQGKVLSEITTDELLALAEELSIRKQEERYVQAATISSLCFPGFGQFVTGKTGLGLIQSGLHLGIIAGSLTGAYLLLPETVKQTMNTQAEIQSALLNTSIRDFFPSMAIMAGGFMLDVGLAVWSASDARRTARENVASGKVTFTPDLRINAHSAVIGIGISF